MDKTIIKSKGLDQILKKLNYSDVLVQGTSNFDLKTFIVWYLNKKHKIIWIADDENYAQEIATRFNALTFRDFDEKDEKNYQKLIEQQKNLAKISKGDFSLASIAIKKLFDFAPSKKDLGFALKKNNKISLNHVIGKISQYGYRRENRVLVSGDFASRGDILDIFEITNNRPTRIDFLNNKIDRIYHFDPSSGEKIKDFSKINIHTIKFDESNKSFKFRILDYLSKDFLIIIDKPEKIIENLKTFNMIDPNIPKWEKFLTIIHGRKIYLDSVFNFGYNAEVIELDYKKIKSFEGNLDNARDDILFKKSLGYQIFNTDKIDNFLVDTLDLPIPDGIVSEKDKIIFYTNRSFFGAKPKIKSITQMQLDFIQSLKIGDLIVHLDHGVGKYLGTTELSEDSKEKYLIIEYQDNARVYVPFSQVKKISKYVGISGVVAQLDRLGSRSWANKKRKVQESAFTLAKELLEIEAIRATSRGFEFRENPEWEEHIKNSFKFRETQGQIKAISDVFSDMNKDKPMDRLICGDVSFGKTEVAIRAATRAVASNKQVVILAPTTILSAQHVQTFRERMKDLPVKIDFLSRFKQKKEQKETIDRLKKGQIDIIIGTHRLLQNDIYFKDLGLVIIDEEQRFGVKHKETFKMLRAKTDILTLTATPIPRTLYFSLAGIRDISKIDTPPSGRMPIKTKVFRYNEDEISRIINSEIERGGQVYYVHNRVQTIYSKLNRLRTLLGRKIRIAVAHGQMNEKALGKVMGNFAAGESDLLLATSIIENGLDLSNVNTLIVENAEKFGLSDLYQLRGRIGRSDKQAYAYFIICGKVGKDARKRLLALLDAKDLGEGYSIAIKDLEIRGGGNILGKEQSGHIAMVGLTLYSRLLRQTVRKIRVRA